MFKNAQKRMKSGKYLTSEPLADGRRAHRSFKENRETGLNPSLMTTTFNGQHVTERHLNPPK
jgi:hypothetical protein